MGWVPRIDHLGDRIEQYADVVLGVSSSDTFGRIAVEAALAGLRTIAWDVPGYPDTVPLLNGALVTPFDVEAMASEMDKMVDHPDEYGDSRRATAEATFGRPATDAWGDWITSDL